MEWVTIRSLEYKVQARGCWHLWFAWHPVAVKAFPDGAIKVVWLKTVKRKGTYKLTGYDEPTYEWVYQYQGL